MKTVYTAEATAEGGRDGKVSTPDDRLDLGLSMPESLGGSGGEGRCEGGDEEGDGMDAHGGGRTAGRRSGAVWRGAGTSFAVHTSGGRRSNGRARRAPAETRDSATGCAAGHRTTSLQARRSSAVARAP